jgi:DNA-binding response OmpR family regulator
MGAPPEQRPVRVLVIDDEESIRLLYRINLEAEGFEVDEAADGIAGLERARQGNPDIILLDVMMPGLDGWGVAEALLEDERTWNLPFVFLTARAEIQDQIRGLTGGSIEYITKPFDPAELSSRIREIIERHEQGESSGLRRQRLADLARLLS